MQDEPIRIRGLGVTLGGRRIIDGLDMDISGGSVCLFGKSGCGKSTLLNVLAGLIKPDEGIVAGLPEKVAYLFQEDRLLPWVDAVENICAATRIPPEKAREWLLRMGLQAEDTAKLPAQLSGGMKRRVAIARALAYEGGLLLMDEPFRGLDGERREGLMQLLKEHTRGRRIVLVTHDMYEAESLCSRIIRLEGPPLEIIG